MAVKNKRILKRDPNNLVQVDCHLNHLAKRHAEHIFLFISVKILELKLIFPLD